MSSSSNSDGASFSFPPYRYHGVATGGPDIVVEDLTTDTDSNNKKRPREEDDEMMLMGKSKRNERQTRKNYDVPGEARQRMEAALQEALQTQKPKILQIAKSYGIAKKSLYARYQEAVATTALEKKAPEKRKRGRTSAIPPEVEVKIASFARFMHTMNLSLFHNQLRQVGAKVAASMGFRDSNASNGWSRKFSRKFGLDDKMRQKSKDSTGTMNQYKVEFSDDQLNDIVLFLTGTGDYAANNSAASSSSSSNSNYGVAASLGDHTSSAGSMASMLTAVAGSGMAGTPQQHQLQHQHHINHGYIGFTGAGNMGIGASMGGGIVGVGGGLYADGTAGAVIDYRSYLVQQQQLQLQHAAAAAVGLVGHPLQGQQQHEEEEQPDGIDDNNGDGGGGVGDDDQDDMSDDDDVDSEEEGEDEEDLGQQQHQHQQQQDHLRGDVGREEEDDDEMDEEEEQEEEEEDEDDDADVDHVGNGDNDSFSLERQKQLYAAGIRPPPMHQLDPRAIGMIGVPPVSSYQLAPTQHIQQQQQQQQHNDDAYNPQSI